MNISIKNGFLTLQSDDALCTLTSTSVTINEYVMDFPGEYERRGVFVEIREMSGQLGYILTVEGRTLIYITEGVTLELLEVFRDLNNKDMVICPVNEALWKTVESWEPSVVLVHGTGSDDFLTKLGHPTDSVESAQVRSSDFDSEITRYISIHQ